MIETEFESLAKKLAEWLDGSQEEAYDVLLYLRAMKLHDDDPEDYRPDWLASREIVNLNVAIRDALETKRCTEDDVSALINGLVDLLGDPKEGNKDSEVRHRCVPSLLTCYEMVDYTEWLASCFLPSIVSKDVIDPDNRSLSYFPLVWTIDGYSRYAETAAEADCRRFAFQLLCCNEHEAAWAKAREIAKLVEGAPCQS